MPNRPNILWLITDQHNPHVAGFAGDRYARTQNLDRLAERSVRFDAAYCQTPLCVPSRISMLTGKYAHGCSAWNNGSMLYPDHITLPEHLSQHGYTTVLVGKMHLRGPRWMGGFEHRPYGDLIVDRFCFHQPDPVETWDGRWCSHAAGRFPFAGPTQIPESLLVDGVTSREALAFLLEHTRTNPDKPWLMCASYSRPHFPLTAPRRYIDRAMADPPPLPQRPPGYPDSLHPHDSFIVRDFRLTEFSEDEQRRALACYYACVDYVDDCIGELLDGLRSAGLLGNTYIIYMSDHGDMAGEHGLWWKRTYYEASAAVPLLVAGPDIASGAAVQTPVELVDLLPTFCDLADVPAPQEADGESLAPLIRGEANLRSKRVARSELLAPRLDVDFRMARDERWKYVEFPQAAPVLFDLENDPGETTNLYGTDAAESAPIDDLRVAACAGLSWDEIAAMREEEIRNRPAWKVPGVHGPAQYQLPDGRIVEADAFLYPGLLG